MISSSLLDRQDDKPEIPATETRDFSINFLLVIHTRIHTGEKPFKCNVCSYASARKSDLIRHTRIHTGEKPFKCDVCYYAAARRSNLAKHTSRIHTARDVVLHSSDKICNYKR